MVLCIGFAVYGQDANQHQAYYGKKAADLIPGAVYILKAPDEVYPSSVKLAENSGITESGFISWYRQSLNIPADIGFVMVKKETDNLGFLHERYTQTYKSIPVDRGEIIVQYRNGQVTSINGDIFPVADISVTPGLSEANALELAKSHIGATKYMWEDQWWEQEIKSRTEDNSATYFPKGELTITKFGIEKAEVAQIRYRLAYYFDIHALSPSIEQRVYVDANTGEILYTLPLASDCEPAVDFTSIFNGTRSVRTDKYTGSDYRLRDDCIAAEVHVWDWGSATSTASPVEIDNTTNT